MIQEQVPIGTVKRDISELVNRVAFGSERIVLTSRGKPKAALISIEDLERLTARDVDTRKQHLEALIEKSNRLNERIMARRNGVPIDVDSLWRSARDELEARGDDIIQSIIDASN